MSKLFSRKAFIPFWIVVCILVAAVVSPMTWATGLLLLVVGTVVPVAAIFLGKAPPPTIAEVLNRAERSATRF